MSTDGGTRVIHGDSCLVCGRRFRFGDDRDVYLATIAAAVSVATVGVGLLLVTSPDLWGVPSGAAMRGLSLLGRMMARHLLLLLLLNVLLLLLLLLLLPQLLLLQLLLLSK